jgi:hypothetical protein
MITKCLYCPTGIGTDNNVSVAGGQNKTKYYNILHPI